MVFSIGNILYISLLLVNAIAVLSEERFLARSACHFILCSIDLFSSLCLLHICFGTPLLCPVGWSTQQPQMGSQGFTQPYDAGYGGAGSGQGDLTVKMKLVNLIGAVRTLMRSECLVSFNACLCCIQSVCLQRRTNTL